HRGAQRRHRAGPARLARALRRRPRARHVLPQRHGRPGGRAGLEHHRPPRPDLGARHLGRCRDRSPTRRRVTMTAEQNIGQDTVHETAPPQPGPQTAPPQDVRVGVIGVGRMGADHVERISRRIKGARVSLLSDDLRVDAVLCASPGEVHHDQVMACIAAGRPVLCEKPLAMSPADAHDVVRAEHEAGRAYVSLGFMRRFDAGYGELKDALEAGDLGTPLILNCKHRNADVLPGFTNVHMVYDSAVHAIDAISFFLEEPVVSVQTLTGRSTESAPEGLSDPMLLLFRTAAGTVVTDELYVSTGSGYEVRTELVGSQGVATIGQESGL